MKVLLFTSQIHLLGGAEKLAVELAEGLNSQPKVQADLLSMVSEDIPGTADTKQRLLNNGVQSVRFLGRPPGTSGRNMLLFVLKLRRILQTGDYDFVETSMPGPTMLACWATLGLRTRLIAGIHVIYEKDYQANWSDWFLRFSVRANRRMQFYAISKQAMNHWVDYARVKPERVRVVYNSIAEEHFKITERSSQIGHVPNIGGRERVILFVGRICKSKGLDTLIDALGPILKQENVHLLIIGGPNTIPETDYTDQIMKQVTESIWSEHVHFLGYREDIPQIMNSVDVLVHPTRREGFGLVLAEALAAGLPVVATDVGGIPEVLADTDSILVPPDDPIAMRNAVLAVLHRTPSQAARCRNRALKRSEFFRSERRTKEMIAFFSGLSCSQAKK